MNNYFIKEIADRNRSMMELSAALNLYYLLQSTLDQAIPGSIAELGCYRGLTAVLIQKVLMGRKISKELHVFDSFEGLPEKKSQDYVENWDRMRKCDYKDNQRIGKGWFSVGVEELKQQFQNYSVPLPTIHKGWFKDTLENELPDHLSFVHLDGDFYSSTKEGLEAVYPRCSPGAIVILDDYCDPGAHVKQSALPGVKVACDEFFQDKPEKIHLLATDQSYQAYFRKL